jgi:hypothetical protein
MRRPGLLALLSGLALVGVGACVATPTIQFVVDDGGTRIDAGVISPFDATPSVPSSLDDDGDDGGSDAASQPVQCGTGQVKGCNACPGKPLRCTDNGRNDCVADCAECVAGTYPCFHCPPNGALRGTCVAPNANGKINCTNANRCSCATASDCPASAGAAQECQANANGGAGSCVLCGEQGSNGAVCVDSTGDAGKCAVNGGAPICH